MPWLEDRQYRQRREGTSAICNCCRTTRPCLKGCFDSSWIWRAPTNAPLNTGHPRWRRSRGGTRHNSTHSLRRYYVARGPVADMRCPCLLKLQPPTLMQWIINPMSSLPSIGFVTSFVLWRVIVCFTTFCTCLTAALFPSVAQCVNSTTVIVTLKQGELGL
jgi:hypothetical protein